MFSIGEITHLFKITHVLLNVQSIMPDKDVIASESSIPARLVSQSGYRTKRQTEFERT